ncbi:MBL fold metallo-hydrolase [Paenibacillus frigoriresistens]|uniref:MBL fold metallo-hydrolase n=1 Tax=Paenibacillus alginolyticus TaxID=59839 RepID=UPI001565810C|nr:MBL fold metallo-hydrolase [Paenibacillus frigoriresistens]NRF91509.1 MBL fold metallo-hydrolase [Paenibacillus frigoriresistens]
MEVKIVASGSDGNCVFIKSGNSGVLIDAGKWKRDIEKRLNEKNINPVTDIQAICITHSHSDHIRGLTLANKYSYPVYATEGEWRGISGVNDDLKHTLSTAFGKYELIELGDLHVYPFRTYHDAHEPVGYAIEDDIGNRCCVVFDTGKIDEDMLHMMEGNIYVVEANHDEDLLINGTYADHLKARILSEDRGHLSNAQTAAALKRLIQGKQERIILTHISGRNNTPMHARAEVMRALREKGFKDGEHYHLEVCSD